MDQLWDLVQQTWIEDDSGNGFVASESGATWIPDGPVDGALTFDGTGSIDIGGHQEFATAQGSIEFWFSTDETLEEDDLVNIYENGYYDFLLVRRTSAGQIMLYIEDEDAQILYILGATVVESNSWTHVVLTQDGSEARIYINGEDSLATGQNSDAWMGHLAVEGGWLSYGHWYGHSGGLDEVRIYDRALEDAEIAEHYAGVFDDETGLIAHWSFDVETSGEAGEFLGEYYATSFSPNDSIELLQFLPTFVEQR